MSKIREILTPMLIESQGKQAECESLMVRVVQSVGQLDINLDMMRQCLQILLDDCDQVLNQSAARFYHSWDGCSLNTVHNVKQRADIMLRLLDGEVVDLPTPEATLSFDRLRESLAT